MGDLYKKSLIVFILIFNIINNIMVGYCNEYNSTFYREINNEIELELCEGKVQGSFQIKTGLQVTLDSIVKNINEIIGQVTFVNDDDFVVESNHRTVTGNISKIPYKNTFLITLSINVSGQKLDYDEINVLKNKFEKVLSPISSEVEYSLCVRSKILNNTMEEANNIILNKLKEHKAQETESLKINNGYCISSNLGESNKRIVLGRNIDFNCAIVKYSSGCYLIMGTPEINITY